MLTLRDWGKGHYEDVIRDEKRYGALVRDLGQAFYQHTVAEHAVPSLAFQQIVWDLYAGFFDPDDFRNMSPPLPMREPPLPPLVCWVGRQRLLWTWTAAQTC